jgi:ribosomal protein S18 acetylase RimI-like enzyme
MSETAFGGKPLVLRCARCGKFVNWEEARVQVVCSCRPQLELSPVLVREASAEEREQAQQLFKRDFGPTQLVAYGAVIDIEDMPTLVAEINGELGGALAWRHFDNAFHIVALATDPMWQRASVGGHLLAEAELLARRQQQPRVIVAITNDNLPALYFYQRRGYRIAAIVRDSAAAHARGHEMVGFAGIPILDEIQLVKEL